MSGGAGTTPEQGVSEEGALPVVACGPADRERQADLFNRCFKKRVDRAGLDWRYDANPSGPALTFIRESDGRAVSGYACNPRRAISRGRKETMAVVGQTGDVMTDPDWRKRGLFSGLDRAAMEASKAAGWPLVFGLPNRRSAHIFLELGWERVGSVRPYTLVLRPDRAAREARRREGRLAGLLTPFTARSARTARRALDEAAGDFERRPLARFPHAVKGLSARVERDFGIMVRRDADYLDWRFRDAPSGLHRAVGLFDSAGALAGYVVVQLPREGSGAGYLVDVLAPDEGARRAAIAAGLDELEAGGASVVEATAMDESWWAGQLRGAGFVAPRPENHLAVILHVHDPESPLVAAARDPRAWYFTDGDRDDETMG